MSTLITARSVRMYTSCHLSLWKSSLSGFISTILIHTPLNKRSKCYPRRPIYLTFRSPTGLQTPVDDLSQKSFTKIHTKLTMKVRLQKQPRSSTPVHPSRLRRSLMDKVRHRIRSCQYTKRYQEKLPYPESSPRPKAIPEAHSEERDMDFHQ